MFILINVAVFMGQDLRYFKSFFYVTESFFHVLAKFFVVCRSDPPPPPPPTIMLMYYLNTYFPVLVNENFFSHIEMSLNCLRGGGQNNYGLFPQFGTLSILNSYFLSLMLP